MSTSHRRPLALVIAASPARNVPPLVNVPRVLGLNGFKTLVIAYEREGLPRFERLGAHGAIFRVSLTSRSLKPRLSRTFVASLEFLFKSARILNRLKPQVVIYMDYLSALLLRMPKREGRMSIVWPLEFYETGMPLTLDSLLIKASASSWDRAQVLVAPTPERLAMHLAVRPSRLQLKTMVVHNCPPLTRLGWPRTQPQESLATARLQAARKAGLVSIVHSGAVGNIYGLDRLICAVAKQASLFLLIIGKKHPLAEAEIGLACQAAGDCSRIEWVDELNYDVLTDVLSLADVGFCHYDSFRLNTRFAAPGKLYEYLRAGLVVLTNEQCSIRPLLEAYNCGVFFSSKCTSNGIAAVTSQLSTVDFRLEYRKQQARLVFEKHLNLEVQMADVMNVLHRDCPS